MCWCVSAHVHALTAYKQQYRFNYCRPSSCLLQWFRVCRCKLECLLGFFFNFVGLFVCWGKVCWLITSSVFLILQFCTDVVENNTCLAVEHHWKSLFSDILLIGTKNILITWKNIFISPSTKFTGFTFLNSITAKVRHWEENVVLYLL